MKASLQSKALARLIVRFLGEMHCFDAGCMLPLLHAQKLTGTQLATLEFVFEPRTISTVASFLGLSRPATSQMIHKLVHRRLVRRSEGTVDRREKDVVVSGKGKALVKAIASARGVQFSRTLAILPHRSVVRLKAALGEAMRHMDKPGRARRQRTTAR
jgi:DNA-binding MarR family transcriptional regulator